MSTKSKTILVVGCGALGGYLSAVLSRHADVGCYDVDGARVRTIKSQGIVLRINGRRVTAHPFMSDQRSAFRGRSFDGVIMTTKCRDVRKAATETFRYAQSGRVLFLQNGEFPLGWTRKILSRAAICRGVTTSAVYEKRQGEIVLAYKGHCYVGALSGKADTARWFANFFRQAGLGTTVVRDYRSAVWAKLIFSAVMNPLPVLTGTDYGIIRQDDRIYALVREAVEEGKRVAMALGISLAFDPANIVNALRRGKIRCQHRGSMAHDFVRGNPLELDQITGEIVRQAKRLKIKTPVLETINVLTKALEQWRDAKR